VLQALQIAARQPGNPRLEEVGRHLGALMENGDTFAEAVARLPDVFTPFYVQMARQGEADGVLGGALVSLADYLDQEIRQGPGGARMCETCVRREVARLKAPARRQPEALAQAAVSPDGDDGIDGLPSLAEPDPFAPPERQGKKFQL